MFPKRKWLSKEKAKKTTIRRGDMMTEKQRKFAEYYSNNGNATYSAVLSGYSSKTAYSQGQRLLKNVEVSAYLHAIAKKEQNERIMSAVKRQGMLSDIANDTNNTPSDRIKAIDTLNKMTGEYTVKVDTTVQTSPKFADVLSQLGGKGLED